MLHIAGFLSVSMRAAMFRAQSGPVYLETPVSTSSDSNIGTFDK